MKTLHTNDPQGTEAFLSAIEFKKQCSPRSHEDAIHPHDEFEISEEKPTRGKKSQVIITKGVLVVHDFLERLVNEFKFTHIDSKETGPISQVSNFETPFGFTFHVSVTFA